MGDLRPLLVGLLLAAAPASAQCELEGTQGQQTGTWDEPVILGTGSTGLGGIGPAGNQWVAHDISNPAILAALDQITITLDWNNSVNGSADFGIAVGIADGAQYWNQQYQAAAGPQQESITLDRGDLEAIGWVGDDLRIGPSISTGGGSTSGIDYTISWDITLDPEICDDPSFTESTDDDGATPAGGGIPVQWWIALGLVVLGLTAIIVFSTRK